MRGRNLILSSSGQEKEKDGGEKVKKREKKEEKGKKRKTGKSLWNFFFKFHRGDRAGRVPPKSLSKGAPPPSAILPRHYLQMKPCFAFDIHAQIQFASMNLSTVFFNVQRPIEHAEDYLI